jgi:hypothetical protein
MPVESCGLGIFAVTVYAGMVDVVFGNVIDHAPIPCPMRSLEPRAKLDLA